MRINTVAAVVVVVVFIVVVVAVAVCKYTHSQNAATFENAHKMIIISEREAA